MEDILLDVLDEEIIFDAEEVEEEQEQEQENETGDDDTVDKGSDTDIDDDVIIASDINVDEDAETPEGEQGDESNVYGALAEALKEEAFFKDTDVSEVSDMDSLASAFKEEIKKNEFSDLNDSQKRVLEGFRNGIPQDEIMNTETTFEKLNSITDENLESNDSLVKDLIIRDLTSKGISEGRADQMYNLLVDTGEAKAEAKQSLDNMKEAHKADYDSRVAEFKQVKEDSLNKANKLYEDISNSINDTENFLGGYKVTDRLKENVINTMSTAVGYDDQGNPYNALMKSKTDDPVNFESSMYYLFTITDGFKNLEAFTKKAESKAAKSLESKLRQTGLGTVGKPGFQSQPKGFENEIIDV